MGNLNQTCLWNCIPEFPGVNPNSNCKGIYFFLIYLLIIVVIYYVITFLFFKKFSHRDYLNQTIYQSPCLGKISWWPISHFVLYFILGLLFPFCDPIIIAISIFWELFEEFMGCLLYNNGVKMPFKSNGDKNVQYQGRWWRGSAMDIIYNLLGYYSAKALVLLFNWNIQIPGINSFS